MMSLNHAVCEDPVDPWQLTTSRQPLVTSQPHFLQVDDPKISWKMSPNQRRQETGGYFDRKKQLILGSLHLSNDQKNKQSSPLFFQKPNLAGFYVLQILSTEQKHVSDFIKNNPSHLIQVSLATFRLKGCFPMIEPIFHRLEGQWD